MYRAFRSFGAANQIRADRPLTDTEIRESAPSVFAEDRHQSRSQRYAYIPTYEVLDGLRREGFQPFLACQARVRDESRMGHAKHMLRLRHESVMGERETNEIILINSHDGTSSYQMFAGVFRFVCCNGMVVGNMVEEIRVPHRGDVIGQVIEGAYRILDQFEVVDESREVMRTLPLTEGEQTAFARAAMQLRWEDEPAVTESQVLKRRRSEDADDNLWTTFNVVQENLVRGGLYGRSRNGRRTRTRAVQGIDGNVALNRALWTLAEEMKRLKAA
ncbi:MAG TPA: DUF945 domain-containing protein [Rhodobacteraceae bacterium]|nr:DUF945 domain-containing protein [Paracoccaceae bacterium]